MKPLYIFDIDGTIADVQHRLHYIERKPKDYESFFRARSADRPIPPVIQTLQMLRKSGAEIWFWTGCSDEVRAETIDWLQKHRALPDYWDPMSEQLKMRKAGDKTEDTNLKQGWLKKMDSNDRKRLVAVFEDRQSVVDMWRENGVPCFQVAEGDF